MELLGPEHHREVRAMVDGELDVGDADVEEVAVAPCGVEGIAEPPVPLDGDGGEQPGLVAEVIRGRRMCDTGAPGDGAQRQRRQAGFLDRRDGGAHQGDAQITVVVGAV